MEENFSGYTTTYQGRAYRISREVLLFLEKNQKILAIKQLRTEYSLDLREAKGVAEHIDSVFLFSRKSKLDVLEKKESAKDFKLESFLKSGAERLTDFFASIEIRLDRLERRNIEVNKAEETRRLLELQSDRLTAQSNRIDKLVKEMEELETELEKRPRRRVIVRKKEREKE